MRRNARFCRVCGQAFHGHGLWRTCPGCRAEVKARKREGRVSKDWNLAPGVTPDDIDARYGAGEPRTCGNCAHCLVRACDIDPSYRGGGVSSGHCEELGSYVHFDNWCGSWEER